MVQIIKKTKDDEKDKGLLEIISVEELREGSAIFESKGISYVKVTYDGVGKMLALPIKSSGVSELIDEFRRQAPIPPTINYLAKPDDEIGRALKLTQKKHVKMFDLTDKDYLEAKEQYESDLGLKIVLKGLNVPLKDKDGKLVEDDDKKLDILRGMGITGEQFSQLVTDISSLTKIEQEENENLS